MCSVPGPRPARASLEGCPGRGGLPAMQGTGVPRTVEAPERALSCCCRLVYGSDSVDRSPCGCVPVTGRWQHSDAVLRVCSRAEVVSCQPVAGAGRACLCAHDNDTPVCGCCDSDILPSRHTLPVAGASAAAGRLNFAFPARSWTGSVGWLGIGWNSQDGSLQLPERNVVLTAIPSSAQSRSRRTSCGTSLGRTSSASWMSSRLSSSSCAWPRSPVGRRPSFPRCMHPHPCHPWPGDETALGLGRLRKAPGASLWTTRRRIRSRLDSLEYLSVTGSLDTDCRCSWVIPDVVIDY